MSPWRIAALTSLALLAFAGNSLLARAALRDAAIDPAAYTALRLASGAVALALLLAWRDRRVALGGGWAAATALFVYAAAFSVAYVELTAATGALLLFGAVQATMVGRSLAAGQRYAPRQWAGIAAALGGVIALLLPGWAAPPPLASAAMVAAGVAWGAYTLLGRRAGDALAATAGNFVRALAPAAVFAALAAGGSLGTFGAAGAIGEIAAIGTLHVSPRGALLALVSGAIASGLGYAVWYTALPRLSVAAAAVAQLAVPALTAVAGVAWLGEPGSTRLVVATLAIVGGIAAVVLPARGAR